MAQLIKIKKMWYSDFRQNGHRINRALSPFREKAQVMLDDMLALRRAAKHGAVPTEVSWGFFKARYFEYCKASKSAQTLYRDTLAFRMLDSSVYIRRLTDITPELLERVKGLWQEDGKTLSVITRGLKSIKTAMRKAEDWKYISPQNWRTLKLVEPKARLIYYTMEQYEKLLGVCHDHWLTGALLMGRAGLRSGEAYHLEWSDVDFNLGKIHIHPKAGWKTKGNKSRWIPLDGSLQRYLESLPRHSPFVLGGDRPTLGSWQAYMKRLIKKAKLPGSPHALRHTFATHLVSNGRTLEEVGELLGHSNPKTTKIYAHLMPQALNSAIKSLPPLSSTFPPGSKARGLSKVPQVRQIVDGKRRNGLNSVGEKAPS